MLAGDPGGLPSLPAWVGLFKWLGVSTGWWAIHTRPLKLLSARSQSAKVSKEALQTLMRRKLCSGRVLCPLPFLGVGGKGGLWAFFMGSLLILIVVCQGFFTMNLKEALRRTLSPLFWPSEIIDMILRSLKLPSQDL